MYTPIGPAGTDLLLKTAGGPYPKQGQAHARVHASHSLHRLITHADALQRALMMLASACHQAVSAVSFSSLSLSLSLSGSITAA